MGRHTAGIPHSPETAVTIDEPGDMTDSTDPVDDLAPRAGDALLIVDLQRDFLPGGPLAVADADAIVPLANRLIDLFAGRSLPVLASRDWHPPDHCSFTENGGAWPPHCVAETSGAGFAQGLNLNDETLIISKGTTTDRDAYSAFERTDLAGRLRARAVRRLFVCGVATDVCVQSTVRDALHHGFEVVLLTDAIRGVDRNAGDSARAIREMQQAGARIATTADVLHSGR
jgi:nicotinamidase/pyrazinamidase